ncbi:MAG: DivIVA domain-containing protein [Clostridiales bacterium]|nr:DivIVA domain-containing protein [Candidatus Crickella merdequi]
MIMPIDIDKKEFSRDKRGYNSREVDEFLDLIAVDYEKVLNDNRSMAHKIKSLEKQLQDAQKSDTAMLDTLETAKKLMADISASAERRAELMMRDAELESENMLLDAKMTVKKLNEEHLTLISKVERLRANYKTMLTTELEKLEHDEYDLLRDIDRSDLTALEKSFDTTGDAAVAKQETLVVQTKEAPVETAPVAPVKDLAHATISDLSESLKKMAEDQNQINDTIILK